MRDAWPHAPGHARQSNVPLCPSVARPFLPVCSRRVDLVCDAWTRAPGTHASRTSLYPQQTRILGHGGAPRGMRETPRNAASGRSWSTRPTPAPSPPSAAHPGPPRLSPAIRQQRPRARAALTVAARAETARRPQAPVRLTRLPADPFGLQRSRCRCCPGSAARNQC